MYADEYFDHWQVIWRDLLRAVSMLKDEDLAFRPAGSRDRSVGEILCHMIELEQGWVQYVIRREIGAWPKIELSQFKSVASLRKELERTHQGTVAYLSHLPTEDFNRIVQIPGDGTPKLAWILWHVLEQQIHHRGELFLCLSLLGYQRPKTDRPG